MFNRDNEYSVVSDSENVSDLLYFNNSFKIKEKDEEIKELKTKLENSNE